VSTVRISTLIGRSCLAATTVSSTSRSRPSTP